MWDNQEDARMRLLNSVVRFKDQAVTITDINAGLTVYFTYLATGNASKAAIESRDWDWSPVPTGYVNTNRHAVYVERMPVRKWKQGLHRDNTKIRGEGQRLIDRDIIFSKHFAQTVKMKFPKYKDALKDVTNNKYKSRAFSLHYSLDRDEIGLLWLMYRGFKVGWYAGEIFQFGDGFGYLQEELDNAIQEAV